MRVKVAKNMILDVSHMNLDELVKLFTAASTAFSDIHACAVGFNQG